MRICCKCFMNTQCPASVPTNRSKCTGHSSWGKLLKNDCNGHRLWSAVDAFGDRVIYCSRCWAYVLRILGSCLLHASRPLLARSLGTEASSAIAATLSAMRGCCALSACMPFNLCPPAAAPASARPFYFFSFEPVPQLPSRLDTVVAFSLLAHQCLLLVCVLYLFLGCVLCLS